MRTLLLIFGLLFSPSFLIGQVDFCDNRGIEDYCETLNSMISRFNENNQGYKDCYKRIQPKLQKLLDELINEDMDKNDLSKISNMSDGIIKSRNACRFPNDVITHIELIKNKAEVEIKNLEDKSGETSSKGKGCDINDGQADCDNDGVVNSEDCYPEDSKKKFKEGDECKLPNNQKGVINHKCNCVKNPTTNGFSLKNLLWLLILPFLILIFFVSKFWKEAKELKLRLKNLKSTTSMVDNSLVRQPKQNPSLSSKNAKIYELERTVGDKNREIRNLERRIAKLENDLTKLTTTGSTGSIIGLSPKTEPPPKTKDLILPKTYIAKGYFSAPHREGQFFRANELENMMTPHTYYEFFQINSTEAEFSLIDNSSTHKAAIRAFDRVIAPVCEGINAFSTNAKGIKIIEAGKLYKEGELWKVVEGHKCQIKYL